MPERLTFALPKGRILARALPLLAAAGIDIAPALDEAGRKLLFELPGAAGPPGPNSREPHPVSWTILLVKPVDVPTYVEHGIADLGIAGLDTLLEQGRDLYEPVDLGIGRCRLVVAEPRDAPRGLQRGMELRVATKYPRCALRHYRARGIQPDIIPLWGSVELGPLTGLADQIVDLVESGETLRQNALVEVETVFEVSSRLIVNAASLRLKQPAVSHTIAGLRRAVEAAGLSAGRGSRSQPQERGREKAASS